MLPPEAILMSKGYSTGIMLMSVACVATKGPDEVHGSPYHGKPLWSLFPLQARLMCAAGAAAEGNVGVHGLYYHLRPYMYIYSYRYQKDKKKVWEK